MRTIRCGQRRQYTVGTEFTTELPGVSSLLSLTVVDGHHTVHPVIRTFRHRGLKDLYERGRSSRVAQGHVPKLLRILTALDRSTGPDGMDIPGFRLHPLKGRLRGRHAVSVSGNWRVTFRFEDGHAMDVDYLDYH